MQYNEVTGPFRRESGKRTFQKSGKRTFQKRVWEENLPEESLGRGPSKGEFGKRTFQRKSDRGGAKGLQRVIQ